MANAYNDGHSNDEELQAQQDSVHSDPDEKDKADKPEPQEKDSKGKGKGKDSDKSKDDNKKPKSRWPLIILAIIVVLAIIAGIVYWLMRRGLEDTDETFTMTPALRCRI